MTTEKKTKRQQEWRGFVFLLVLKIPGSFQKSWYDGSLEIKMHE